MIHNVVGRYGGVSLFCGIGERSRQAEELYRDIRIAGVLDRTVMVFGQMNEPPGVRFRVGHAARTIAEYFRDQAHRDVLLLIDNIFRFIQAGAEVSGLTGRIPSRVGYQPTLGTELAELEHRLGGHLLDEVALGVVVGLFVGKQTGILGFTWAAVRLGLADLPAGVSWGQVHGVATLGGIGFTMSLFIAALASSAPADEELAKVGILVGSLVSAVVGLGLLRRATHASSRTEGRTIAR